MPVTAHVGAAGELAASRHGAFSRMQAAQSGLTPKVIERLIRDRAVVEPVPGVLVVTGSPNTWRQRLYVATLSSRGVGVAGFRSAAALHGMDGYSEGPLEVIMPSPRRPRMSDLVIHVGPLHDDDILEVDGIRTTSIARTLGDIGSVDSRFKVKLAFEWAWRNGHSLTWFQQTADRLHRPGQHGTKVLQELLVEARLHERPTESSLEVLLECILEDLDGLERQYRVLDHTGKFVGRVDFAIPHRKVALEAHSRKHHFGPDAEQRDAARDARLVAAGWTTRYITKREMDDPSKLRSSVRQLLLA